MRNRRTQRQRGVAMVEFVFAGIAALALMITTVQMSLAMWNYHTLSYAVHETNRYIASHGRDCALGGNSCTITVGNIVTKMETNGIGLAPADMALTLTSDSGTVKTCNPISTCNSDSTQWPPVNALDNEPGKNSTVLVKYTMGAALISLWYRTPGARIGTVALTSQSKIQMLF